MDSFSFTVLHCLSCQRYYILISSVQKHKKIRMFRVQHRHVTTVPSSSVLFPAVLKEKLSMFSCLVLWCPRTLQGLALVIPQNTPIGRWGDALEHMLPHSSASRGAERLGRVAQQFDGRHMTPKCPVYCWGCPTGAYRECLSTRVSSVSMTGDPGQPKEIELCISMQWQSVVNYYHNPKQRKWVDR